MYSYVKYFAVLIVMLSISLSSETKFRYVCYTRSHDTRNTHVFYEIKKPNKIGGLMLVAPRECYYVSPQLLAVTNVAH